MIRACPGSVVVGIKGVSAADDLSAYARPDAVVPRFVPQIGAEGPELEGGFRLRGNDDPLPGRRDLTVVSAGRVGVRAVQEIVSDVSSAAAGQQLDLGPGRGNPGRRGGLEAEVE